MPDEQIVAAARNAARTYWWQLLIIIPACVAVALYNGGIGWFLYQVQVIFQSVFTFPFTPDQRSQNLGLHLVITLSAMTMFTWWILNTRGWQTLLLDSFFISEWQKTLFKIALMRTLEDAFFLFTMRQAVVLWSAIFMPSAIVLKHSNLDWGQYLLVSIDSKVAFLLYFATSLLWYGLQIKLYDLPLNPIWKYVCTQCVSLRVYYTVCGVFLSHTSYHPYFLGTMLALSRSRYITNLPNSWISWSYSWSVPI
jgi:hypothetical protein